MDERTNGIILRLRPFSDTSVLVHWLTFEHGRLFTVAKGANRSKSPFRGKLDLMFEAHFSFRRSRRSDIHGLTEVALAKAHNIVRKDISCLRLMAYATCFVEQMTETETPIPGIHSIFTTLIDHLSVAPFRPALMYSFEMKLLNELGMSPALKDNRLDDSTVELLEQLAIQNWAGITKLCPTNATVRAMNEFLQRFLLDHLGKLPKGREALLEF